MTTSKSWFLVVVGYSILAVAMVGFLTINGVSATAVGTIGTAGLISLGLLFPAAGMLELARRLGPAEGAARRGLVLQSLSLIGLLIGLVVSFVAGQLEPSTQAELAMSISGHVIAGIFILLSGTSGFVGAIYLSRSVGATYLVAGAVLIAIGAALIPASNIALREYWISDMKNYVYQDVGATVAACGFVVAAYSCFVLRRRGRAPAVSGS